MINMKTENTQDEKDVQARFKFNNGQSSLNCSKCSGIIKVGLQFGDDEIQAIRGKKFLAPQFCRECKFKDGTISVYYPVGNFVSTGVVVLQLRENDIHIGNVEMSRDTWLETRIDDRNKYVLDNFHKIQWID